MTIIQDIQDEPWRFDFFDLMRRAERQYASGLASKGTNLDRFEKASPSSVKLPRIGNASSRREEYVILGQDPHLDFPASNLSKFSKTADGRLHILVKFLGLLGPMGALPLATTEEAYHWLLSRDEAFPRFLDIINHRFLQLFYRAWADARPAAQHDCPSEDRFVCYIGSVMGIGSPPFRDVDCVPDSAKLGYSGLLGAKAKSASRLRGLIRGLFAIDVDVDQFVGSRLELDPDDHSRLGATLCGLGVDTMLGGTFYSVQDKIRLRLYAPEMAQYVRYLPDGDRCEALVDLVFLYLGEEFDWDVQLAIPAPKAQPIRLGACGELGWTTWLSPDLNSEGYRSDALFSPAELMRQKRSSGSAAAEVN
jgi:type VI secretion system protein ImpH